jgi:hypothetical protein
MKTKTIEASKNDSFELDQETQKKETLKASG